MPPLGEDPLLFGTIPDDILPKARWLFALQSKGIEVVVSPYEEDNPDKNRPRLAIVMPNGELQYVTKVETARFFNPRFGIWGYGLEPSGGFAQPYIREPNGGGVVVIPYALINQELYIGVTWQSYPADDRNGNRAVADTVVGVGALVRLGQFIAIGIVDCGDHRVIERIVGFAVGLGGLRFEMRALARGRDDADVSA